MIKHAGQTKHCKTAKDILSLQKMFLGEHDRKNLKCEFCTKTLALNAITVLKFRSLFNERFLKHRTEA